MRTELHRMTNAEWLRAMKRVFAWNCICGSSALILYLMEKI